MMQRWKGLRILNTRPAGQNKKLSEAIREVGAVSIECPALVIEPVQYDVVAQLNDLSLFDKAIFISANAVTYFFDNLQAGHLNWPTSIQVFAIGSATARTLESRGARVDEVPLLATSEGLLDLKPIKKVSQQRILLVKGEGGRDILATTLKQRGATVVSIAVYRRVLPILQQDNFQSLWRKDAVDAIVLTSEEAMHNLFFLFGEAAHAWLRSKICIVKSERLAAAAASFGFTSIVVSPTLNLNL